MSDYTDITTLKARLDISDTSDDDILTSIITAVSRMIDGYCGRRFYTAAETRYYTPDFADVLHIDDVTAITAVVVDKDNDRTYSESWTSSDYELEPVNAAVRGEPYTELWIQPTTSKAFPVEQRRAVKITGTFGYSATAPAAIAEACLLQSARIFRRKDAPFGAAGPSQLGQVTVNIGGKTIRSAIDPAARVLLDPYRRQFTVFGV